VVAWSCVSTSRELRVDMPKLFRRRHAYDTENIAVAVDVMNRRVLTSSVTIIISKYVSKGIYIVQLTNVSLRPGSNIKTKRFEFTPETAVCNILVAQVGRKTVPNTWPGDSEAPVAKCVVLAWNGTRSVGGRA